MFNAETFRLDHQESAFDEMHVDLKQTFVNLSGRYAILTASVFISISISSANLKK